MALPVAILSYAIVVVLSTDKERKRLYRWLGDLTPAVDRYLCRIHPRTVSKLQAGTHKPSSQGSLGTGGDLHPDPCHLRAAGAPPRPGSAPPGPVPQGLIRVYSMRFCPFAQRTLLVLKAKGIGHEIININLKNKPEWFFTKNPFGLVPVLENSQGQLIYESAITCEYLDEAYPGKKLLPDDPYEKACQKMVFQLFSKVPPLVTSFIRRQNNEDGSGLKEELRKEFSKLEEVLTNKKTTFFGGNSLSMIDYLIWPWFERLEVLELNECVDHTPKLKLWMAAMREDPAVSSLLIEAKAFRGFLDLYLQNSPEACDYGL
uniref:Glutathione-dependent dehydroascorbate reductase n=1 Tax=Felis catus TaxID=9685 RepID=A0ABI7VZB1_FELCA